MEKIFYSSSVFRTPKGVSHVKIRIPRKWIVLFLLGLLLSVSVCVGCKKGAEKDGEGETAEPVPAAETEETAITPEPGFLDRLTGLDLEQEGSGEALRGLVEELSADEVSETITELEQELEKRPEAVEIICTLSLLYQRAGNHKQEYEMITRLQVKEKSGVRIPSTLKFIYGRAPALEDELGITAARLMEEIKGLISAEEYEAALGKLNTEKDLLPPDWRSETIARVNGLIADRDAAIAAAKATQEQYGDLRVTVVTEGTLYLDGTRHGTVSVGASASLTDLTVGSHSLEMRYTDGEKETKTVTVTKDRTAAAAFTYKPTGDLQVSTITEGTLYLDGTRQGTVTGGAIKNVTDLPVGSRSVEMRYPDGEWESKTVTVTKNRTAVLAFTYKPEAKTGEYKIGDRGPAGGWIFYDKGSYSDGWRYLEAAPAETEWKSKEWGVSGKNISGADGTAVGTGKQNMADIIAGQGRGNTYAAQLCEGLNHGGYGAWWLPSKDELDLMYKNLHKRGAGGFADGFYWSSSESNSYGAWRQIFYNGSQSSSSKTFDDRVRAVRGF
jgi:hypothetical protein